MNRFGTVFSVSVFGESHGTVVGVTVDGCPAGIKLKVKDLNKDILRRKSGVEGTTARIEDDIPEIVSGVFNDHTTGAPLTILFRNNDTKPSDYSQFSEIPRPGHADYTAQIKHKGFADLRGGGHFSGRLTLPLVAAGVIAKKVCSGIEFTADLIEAGGSRDIESVINKALEKGDSVGGLIECRVKGVPAGLGEPFFDSAESLLCHIIFAIPAVKGIEFGSGFASAAMSGSKHNDVFTGIDGKTATNNAGGINGGITNGNEVVFRVAVKPTSSIALAQDTFNFKAGKKVRLEIKGRHDTCIALRVPVIIEAVSAIVFADLLMIQKGRI